MKLRLAIALLLIALGIGARLLPHEPNFAPVGAIALFAGAMLGWRIGVWLPAIIMITSDLVLGFYPGVGFTWAGFIAISLFGSALRDATILKKIGVGALGTGVIFFVVSNFGVWVSSGMYAPTISGLLECYAAAIPFFRMSLSADLVYSTALFGCYALATYIVQQQSFASSRFLRLQ